MSGKPVGAGDARSEARSARIDRLLTRHGGAFVAARLHRPQTELPHQVGYQADAALKALTVQLGGDPSTA